MSWAGEPKLKSPSADLNDAYLGSWGTYWKTECNLYSLALIYCNHQKDLKLVKNCNRNCNISLNVQYEMHDDFLTCVLPMLLKCFKVVFLKSLRKTILVIYKFPCLAFVVLLLQVISGLGNPRKLLPALFIGPFEHLERFRNLKFAVIRTTNIQSTVLSSSEGTAAIHLAFK